MRDDPWFRALIILGVVALGLYLFGQVWQIALHFGDIIIVFFLAWLLAFILNPLAGRLQRLLGASRGAATGFIYAALLLLIVVGFVIVIPIALEQLVQLGNNLPAVVTLAQGWINFFQAELVSRGFDVDTSTIYRSTDLAGQATTLARGIVTNSISLVSGIASAVFSIVVVLVISFYLVLDGERVLERILDILPTDNASERYFFASINRTFGGFIRGTLLLALLNALGIAVVMSLAGVGFVLISAILAFLLTLVPLVGSALALVVPLLLTAITGNTSTVVLVFSVLVVYQVILFNAVWPKLIGDRMGLHPVLVFLALLVGAKEAGFVGAVFGVPIAGVLYAMGMYFLDRRTPRVEPPAEGTPDVVVVAGPPPMPWGWRFAAERVWPRLREGLSALLRLVHVVVLRLRGGERLHSER